MTTQEVTAGMEIGMASFDLNFLDTFPLDKSDLAEQGHGACY